MQLQIAPDDGTPIYQQIVNQVRHLVASGRLEPGEELPPIRVLAERLLVNPNTVARAYRELEVAGIVSKRRASGTHVSGGAAPLGLRERLELLDERVDVLLTEARQLDVSLPSLLDYLRERDSASQARAEEEVPR